jgi:glycosyltransferase involved in cell wall biosynthesis
MEKSLVSIITPTYNHEKFIGKCIESVLAQSYPQWEQIIVDDGSDDNTEKVVATYKDNRIKYIKQENKGIWRLNETYKKALENSKGEYIAILEGDDYWPDYKLEKQLSSFNDMEVEMSWGKADITNDMNEITGYRPKSINWLKNETNKQLYKYLFFGNFIPACTVMCRRSTLMKIKGFKQCKKFPYVDHTTWLEIGLQGKIKYIDQMLGYWRHHETQISAIKSLEIIQSLEYGIYFLNKLSKYQKKELNIGLIDLITYNFFHSLYKVLYYLENNSTAKLEIYDSQIKKTNISLYLKLRIFFREFTTITKINMKWLKFLIKSR